MRQPLGPWLSIPSGCGRGASRPGRLRSVPLQTRRAPPVIFSGRPHSTNGPDEKMGVERRRGKAEERRVKTETAGGREERRLGRANVDHTARRAPETSLECSPLQTVRRRPLIARPSAVCRWSGRRGRARGCVRFPLRVTAAQAVSHSRKRLTDCYGTCAYIDTSKQLSTGYAMFQAA